MSAGPSTVRRLARYKAWADEVFLAVVAGLPRVELGAPRPILFGSLIRTLHHSYAMDHVWKSHLLGNPHGLLSRNPEHCPALATLMHAQRDIDAWYVAYVDATPGAALEETVRFEFIGGGAGAMTRGDIVAHVVNHSTYHRGQVAAMLYDLGIVPPATDYPVFLRDAVPAPLPDPL